VLVKEKLACGSTVDEAGWRRCAAEVAGVEACQQFARN
jgi:hypothetical protein